MTILILILSLICLGLLWAEDRQVRRERTKLVHVIYVNGIRGKSTVTRLIDAGLRAGGWKVFCKTTGTVPMTIGTDNIERPLVRRGRANIKEQIQVLHQAVKEEAQVLVIECMAVNPALQAVSQHRMVRSDIGVITNVRLDHTAEMGQTQEEICDALSNTIPKNGVLFTAERQFRQRLEENGAAQGCRVEYVSPEGAPPGLDFPENTALALAVCQALGVERERALEGMRRYQPDPYALSAVRLAGGAVFINALSVNDPQSTQAVYRRVSALPDLAGRELVLLVNNRPDRGYRTQHMELVARSLRPREIWLTGASQAAARRSLKRDLPGTPVLLFRDVGALPLEKQGGNVLIFAVGNLAGPGKAVLQRAEEEGEPYVL